MKKIALILGVVILISIFAGCVSINNDSDESKIIYNPPDRDKDGVPDEDDAFPDDPSASIDTDGDGYPNEWNPNKNQSDSTSNPPLVLDDLEHDPTEYKDSDGDEVGDNSDAFPNNKNEWSDLDKDGVGDNSDINPNVNLSLELKLIKFVVTSRVDILKWAQIYFDVIIDNKQTRIDNNGNYYRVWLNNEKSVEKSIFYDIPDDTKKDKTKIEIKMYDYDFYDSDDIVDISNISNDKTLVLEFNNIENKISFEKISSGDKATIWYNIELAESKVPQEKFYNISYSWKFNKKNWDLSVSIPINSYKNYKESKISRIPQNNFNSEKAMSDFVTSNDKTINDIANKLYTFAEDENFDKLSTANFVLRFVQENIDYKLDNETKSCAEYWQFPVETLVELEGDCEDTSVLYAAIMKNLGYDVALIFYSWDEDGEQYGHLSAGIHLAGDHGDYVLGKNNKKYYYCETTAISFSLGQIPSEIKYDPIMVVTI